MDRKKWDLWKKHPMIERRTFLRAKGIVPEMECTKQLIKIIKPKYKKNTSILDVGCAAGHYYNSIKKLDKNVIYQGIDGNRSYINFAKKFYRNSSAKFKTLDIYKLNKKHIPKHDIVYCCNVLLHLPDIFNPLKNLINITKKICIIRTLIDNETHLSKIVFKEKFNNKFEPQEFTYQNTYSIKILKKFISKLGRFKIRLIDDKFETSKINKEYSSYAKIQGPATTKVINNVQIAGNKVFKWKWLIIEKN